MKSFTDWQTLHVLSEDVFNTDENEEVKGFLYQMLQSGQRCVYNTENYLILLVYILLFIRFHIAGELATDILIIGKAHSLSIEHLSDQEKDALVCSYPNIIEASCTVHKRLLIHGVVFSSLEYQRQSTTTCDYVMCFENGATGFVTKYLGFCTTDCQQSSPCLSPCNIVAVAQIFESISHQLIDDQVSGATANHIHQLNPLRYNN